MFDSLSDRLGGVFDKLRGRGALSGGRRALGDARGARRAARGRRRAAGRPRLRRPGHRARGRRRGAALGHARARWSSRSSTTRWSRCSAREAAELNLDVNPPAVIMMVGLQGSGKTTTTAKLAKRLTERERKKVLMASLDVARPAAQEQLAVLGRQANVDTLPIVAGQQPVEIAKRAIQAAQAAGLRRRAARHRRPPPRRRRADGRDEGGRRGLQPGRDPAGGRQPDRPGRGQRRQGLCRRGRPDRRHPDPHGRRCPRRRGAVDARGHRQADQVRRRRRGDRHARGLPPEPRRRPHPRHGRRRQPGRARRRDDPGRGSREARRQDGQGQVRPRRPARPDRPDAAHGRARRAGRHDARA